MKAMAICGAALLMAATAAQAGESTPQERAQTQQLNQEALLAAQGQPSPLDAKIPSLVAGSGADQVQAQNTASGMNMDQQNMQTMPQDAQPKPDNAAPAQPAP